MPEIWCKDCKEFRPIKWEPKERVWRYWPHGPEEKRCTGSGKVANDLKVE